MFTDLDLGNNTIFSSCTLTYLGGGLAIISSSELAIYFSSCLIAVRTCQSRILMMTFVSVLSSTKI